MNRRLFITSLVSLAALPLPRRVCAEEGELGVIVHPSTPVKALSEAELASIFLTTRTDWSDGTRIVPFNLPPKTTPRVDFDEAVLHMTPDDAARFWIDRRVRGGNRPPRQAPRAELMVAVVSRLKGAIGYAPRSMVNAEVKLIATIRNGKVVPP